MKTMTEQELLSLKQKIDKAKTKISESKGKLKHLEKELKDNWDCDSTKKAEIKIREMDQAIVKLDLEIQEASDELMLTYDL